MDTSVSRVNYIPASIPFLSVRPSVRLSIPLLLFAPSSEALRGGEERRGLLLLLVFEVSETSPAPCNWKPQGTAHENSNHTPVY